MDNMFKSIQKDMAKFKSKYITPEAFEAKAPEMKQAYINAIEEFMKSKQFKTFIDKQAAKLSKDMVEALLDSKQMHAYCQKLLSEQLQKGINITWK